MNIYGLDWSYPNVHIGLTYYRIHIDFDGEGFFRKEEMILINLRKLFSDMDSIMNSFLLSSYVNYGRSLKDFGFPCAYLLWGDVQNNFIESNVSGILLILFEYYLINGLSYYFQYMDNNVHCLNFILNGFRLRYERDANETE